MHKARQSNIELLRIIAMLMVLLLHATFETFGYAHTSSITHAPWRWLSIITTAAACMQCVNVFVLITGWFGTSFKLKGLRIVSECTFISLAMFVFMYLLGLPLPHQLYDYLKVIWSYWFVRAYVLLYLFTPVLNSFVQQSSEKQLRHFLVLFFTLSIPLSFVRPFAWIFNHLILWALPVRTLHAPLFSPTIRALSHGSPINALHSQHTHHVAHFMEHSLLCPPISQLVFTPIHCL